MPNYGIHNYANREIGLTTPQVQMATFTPVELKWQGVDPEFLSKHLQYADAKDAEARKEKTAIDAAYSEQRKQVHNDEESLKLFDAQVEDYNKKVKEAVDANMGSYHRLGSTMETLKSEALNSKLIPALTDSNTRYQKWVDVDINARQDIDDLSKEYYRDKAERNYSNNLIKDKDGNIIGSDWKPNVQVYADLHADELAKIAIAFTAYQERAGGDTGTHLYNIDESGKPKEITIKNSDKLFEAKNPRFLSNKKTTSWDWTKLSKEQLYKTFETYLAASPQIREMIREDFAKQEYKRNKALERLQNRESLSEYDIARYEDIVKDFDSNYGVGAGGGGKNFVAHYIEKIKPFLANASYYRTKSITGDNLSYSGGKGKPEEVVNNPMRIGSTSVSGTVVIDDRNNPQAVSQQSNKVKNATDGINDILGNNNNNGFGNPNFPGYPNSVNSYGVTIR